MTSLFSSFDLNNYNVCIIFMFFSFFLMSGMIYKMNMMKFSLSGTFSSLSSFFLTLKPNYFNKGSSLIFISALVLILTTNFFSVFSFNFPWTSQISYVLFISLTFWFSFMIYSLVKNIKGFLFHLIPEGTPLPLTILLFLIELISNIIRPLTLTVRLVANILAGHLLMTLLSSLVFNFPLAAIFYLGLNLVELFVAMIQSYIFTTMVVLYYSEV